MYGETIPTLIIGAGPAGLAVAGRLRHAGQPFMIVEKAPRVAERWHHHYDRVHLHTVKQHSNLPHLPFPEEYPMYVSKEQLIEYFEQYAIHFDIKPQFSTDIYQIRKGNNGAWNVQSNNGELHAKNVIVATGLNRVPNAPAWDGMQHFNGDIRHSIDYRNTEPYKQKLVLVVGMGNTGAEIALDLADAGIPVWLSVRGPVNVVPRDLNGQAVQISSKWLAKLPAGLGDWIGSKVQRLYFGDLSKYGLKQSKDYPAVQLRNSGKTPVIDVGTIKAIKEGRIQVVGGVQSFTPGGVILENGQALKCSAVILATGYRANLPELVEGIAPFLDKNGLPVTSVGSGDYNGLYFVGFDNYKLGGVLGTINTDSEMVVKKIMDDE